MEELKLLVGMVASLPAMAMWVIAFFFAYKVVVVGSIYGVIKYVAKMIHDAYVTKKTRPPEEATYRVKEITITDCMDELVAQLRRIRGKRTNINSSYIHHCSVQWLEEAITDKIQKDALTEQK